MHLTRKVIERWVGKVPPGAYLIRLTAGDRMDVRYHPAGITNVVAGPEIVELTVYRDGGWSAREAHCETPENIALAAGPEASPSGSAPQDETALERQHRVASRRLAQIPEAYRAEGRRQRDRYAQCDDTCTVDCGACKGGGPR